jgi:hypothetical protein
VSVWEESVGPLLKHRPWRREDMGGCRGEIEPVGSRGATRPRATQNELLRFMAASLICKQGTNEGKGKRVELHDQASMIRSRRSICTSDNPTSRSSVPAFGPPHHHTTCHSAPPAGRVAYPCLNYSTNGLCGPAVCPISCAAAGGDKLASFPLQGSKNGHNSGIYYPFRL